MSPVSNATIHLTRFLDARIAELLKTKRYDEIARDVGIRDVSLKNITSGRARLPLDMVGTLAAGLGLDPHDLMILALHQFMAPDVVELVLHAGAHAYTVEVDDDDVVTPAGDPLPEEAINLLGSAKRHARECVETIAKLEALLELRVSSATHQEHEDLSG